MKAVFFDLYETLVTHFDPNWVPPPQSIAQRLGIKESTFTEHWPQLDRSWQAGEISQYGDALTQLCAAEGKEPDLTVIEELYGEYQARIARLFAIIEPEIIEMLNALRRSKLKLGVITNASDLDVEPWQTSELAPLFDDVVISHEVGLLKPDPRIYELACKRIEVRPGDAIFAGDGGSDELRGAEEFGLDPKWCIWFLGRWPAGVTPNGFPGGEWRDRPFDGPSPYERFSRPQDLLAVILS